MEEKTEFCHNCKQNIAVNNYRIHNVHCERNIQLCNICSEPVPRREMQRHLEDSHSIDACLLCEKRMEKWRLENHKNECPKRLFACQFCNLESPLDGLDEHLIACGARTEKCGKCKQYVKLLDKDKHFTSCQKENYLEKTSSCEICHRTVPANLYTEHIAMCILQSEECHTFDTILGKGSEISQYIKENSSEEVVCEYCKESFSMIAYKDHISACESRTEKCLKCLSFIKRKDMHTHPAVCKKKFNSVQGECSVCHQLIPWMQMNVHETVCGANHSGTFPPNARSFAEYSSVQPQSKSYVPKNKEIQNTDNDGLKRLKMCPHCYERLPDLIIGAHTESCARRPYSCKRCLKKMAFEDQSHHALHECEFRQNSGYAAAAAVTNSTKFEKENRSVKAVPCKFCGLEFPVYLYSEHVDLCEMQSSTCPKCSAMVVRKDWERHQYKCKNNTIAEEITFCEYCKGSFPRTTLSQHIPICDSRSEKCMKCNRLVMRKDKPNHHNVCPKQFLESCPICSSEFPLSQIEYHAMSCSKQTMVTCLLCKVDIFTADQETHRKCCPSLLKDNETSDNERSGRNKKKRGKNKSPKDKEVTEQTKQNTWFPKFGMFSRKQESSPVNDHAPESLNFESFELPCEFCNKLYPSIELIEHETGCRPDLTSRPKIESFEAGQENSQNIDTTRTGRKTYYENSNSLNDAKEIPVNCTINQGAMPKRNRIFPALDVVPGEFLGEHNQPRNAGNVSSAEDNKGSQRENTSKPYYKEDSVKSKENKTVVNYENKDSNRPVFAFKTLPGEFLDSYPSNKADSLSPVEDSKHSRRVNTSISKEENMKINEHKSSAKHASEVVNSTFFNFTAKTEKLLEDTHKLNKVSYSYPTSINSCEATKKCAIKENKPIGTERAEKREKTKEIDSSDSQFSYFSSLFPTHEKLAKENQNSSKIQNMPSSDTAGGRNICKATGEVEESQTDNAFLTEYDLKNGETFRSQEPLNKSSVEIEEIETLSDFEESFYDAEEEVKMSDDSPEIKSAFLNKDNNLDSYFSFLKKDVDKVAEFRNVQIEELLSENLCPKCNNAMCYCSVINESEKSSRELSLTGSFELSNDSDDNDHHLRGSRLDNNKTHSYTANVSGEEKSIYSSSWNREMTAKTRSRKKRVNKKSSDTDSD